MKGNPFKEIEDMLARMEDTLDTGTVVESISVDVAERDDEYVVTADLPGYDVEDIDVSYADGRLRIRAASTEETTTEGERYIRQERRQQAVDRTVSIPDRVDDDGIEATYNNGVLTVTLPRTDDEGGRTIEIE